MSELEVLALSCIKDSYTTRTWIVRVPRSKGRCSGKASSSLVRGLFEYNQEPQPAQFGVDCTWCEEKGFRTKTVCYFWK